jgi:hypothetical protein
MSEIIPINNVEIMENKTTASTFEVRNSFLLKPSMRFCFIVLLLYSLATMETIITAKNILKNAAKNVLKCQMYGKLKIP